MQMSLISAQSGTTRRLDAAWRDGHRYQKADVILGDFFSQYEAQPNLFDANAVRASGEALLKKT